MHSTIRRVVSPLALVLLASLGVPLVAGGQRTSRSREVAVERRRSTDDSRPTIDVAEQQADSAYRAAMDALNRGEYSSAATLFQRIAARYPSSTRAASALYYRAFALYKSGGSRNLSSALSSLESLHEDYARDYDRLDASTLRIQICGERARQGDDRCASEVVKQANPDRDVERGTDRVVSSSSSQSRSCPREGDDNDDRVAALNALMQMNGDAALPILEKVLAKRDSCFELRKQAVFLVSQKRGDRSADILMDAARNDPSAEVREQAVFWLGQTNSDRAVTILSEIVEKGNDVELQKKAIFSLSQNRSPRAQQIIRDYALRENAPKEARADAIFWLGQRRDPDNAEFLRNLFRKVKDGELKEKIIFSLSQQRSDGNGKWLIDVALDDREDIEIRKKALFWAGQQNMVSISDLDRLYNGMKDREMKEQIIFTLSQRRDSEAVDKLMSIAKSDADKDLRSKAIFWLSQSRDPRVPKFLEEIINR